MKKLLFVIVAVAILAFAVPMTASAANNSLKLNGQAISSDTTLTKDSGSNYGISDGTVKVEFGTNAVTITLNGVNINDPRSMPMEMFNSNYNTTNIVLEGNNIINLKKTVGPDTIGIKANYVEISGAGTLEVTGQGKNAICAYGISFNLAKGGKVHAVVEPASKSSGGGTPIKIIGSSTDPVEEGGSRVPIKPTINFAEDIAITSPQNGAFKPSKSSNTYYNWGITTSDKDIVTVADFAKDVTIAEPAPVASITSGETTKEYTTVQAAVDAATSSQTVKLISDSTEDVTVASDDELILDLNGHVLKGTGNDSVINNTGKLTISDSNSNEVHYYTVGADELWTWNDNNTTGATAFEELTARPAANAVVAVKGGAITGGKKNQGGGIYNNGTLTLNGGNIIGNNAKQGGGLFMKVATDVINITNGKIIGNTVTGSNPVGGGAAIFAGTFNFTGGEISFNTSGYNAGGILFGSSENKKCEFNMSGTVKVRYNLADRMGGGISTNQYGEISILGGEIKGNKANGNQNPSYIAGGIEIWSKDNPLTLGGDTVITDNTDGNGKQNNLFLDTDNTVTVSNTTSLTDNAKVGVNTKTAPTAGTGVKITGSDNADYSKYFTSDNQAYKVKYVPATTGEFAVAAHLELANYDLGQIASDTTSISLEKNDMTQEQAIAIAKAQKPSLGKTTYIAYKKHESLNGYYEVIYSSNGTNWAPGSPCTLATMKADIANADYFVIGTATSHTHSFTYTADATNKTITATCSAEGCGLTENKVTATLATEDKEYTGEAYAGASITDKTAWDAAGAAALSLKYEGRDGTSYTASETAPTAVGKYTVTMTAKDTEKSVSADFEITEKQLTVSGTTVQSSKEYDRTDSATVTANGTLAGKIGKEDVSLDTVTAAYEDKKVGTGKAITVKYTIKGEDVANYKAPVDNTSLTASISQKQLSVSGTQVDATKTYDGTTTATVKEEGTLSGVIDGDTVNLDASASYKDKNVGTNKEVTITYTISGDDAGNYAKPADGSTTVAITQKGLTVEGTTVNNKTYDGKTDAEATLGTVTGKVDGDNLTVSVKSAEFDDANAGEDKDVTVTYEKAGTDAGNYSLSPETIKADINKAAPTVDTKPSATAITYGDALSDSTLSGGVAKFGGSTVTGEWSWKEGTTKPAVSDSQTTDYAVVFTPDETTYPNLKATEVNVKLTVNQAENSITNLTCADITEGSTPSPSATAAFGTPEYTYSTAEDGTYSEWSTSNPVGTYWVKASVEGTDNYKSAEATASFNVTAKPTPKPVVTKYTVTFDNQGHGTTPQSQKVETGGKVSDPGSLKADGYTFGGWFADKECTKAWNFDKDTVSKNMTLYAKWTENTAIEDCDIVLSNEVYVFNNKVQIPNVTVTDPSGKILTEDKDYKFELEDSKNVGTYAVTVTGIGAYKGGAQASYVINPAPKAIKTVTAGKKKLTVKWKKSSKAYRAQTTRYQIKVSTSKSFKKSKTKTAYAKPGATSKTIKKLKGHKKYYVKMRAYKTVDGQKYWSTWSKVKVKKTR